MVAPRKSDPEEQYRYAEVQPVIRRIGDKEAEDMLHRHKESRERYSQIDRAANPGEHPHRAVAEHHCRKREQSRQDMHDIVQRINIQHPEYRIVDETESAEPDETEPEYQEKKLLHKHRY